MIEDKYFTITSDGRIVQKNNPYFQGRELAQVASGETEEAVRYFSKLFSRLEKYVEGSLKSFREPYKNHELFQKLDQLREEVILTPAIGDFGGLIEKIDTIIEEKSDERPKRIGAVLTTGEQKGEKEVENTSDEPTDTIGREKPRQVDSLESKQDSGIEANTPEQEEKTEPVKAEQYSEALSGFADLVERARESSGRNDWKNTQIEFETIRMEWSELIENDESLVSEPGYQELLQQREAAEKKFTKRKADWVEWQKQRKRDNLDRRAKILDQLQNIIDKKKWQAFKEVNAFSNRWEEIRNLPNEETVQEQENRFQELLQKFNDKKVAFLVTKAQKEEENLTGKLAVLDKLSQLISSIGPETGNWGQLDAEVEELSRQWRKIGHVPLEHSESVWEQFKAVRDDYFNKKMEFNKAFQKETNLNIRKKTQLCENIEALLEENDLAVAVREINNLHKKWKKAGPIPKEMNDELWERFNEATKKFNEIKSRNLDTIRTQEQENLDKKIALCEKVEELMESTNWARTSKEMDGLMRAWKDIGPVPRRKSGKIWKRFKKALDVFYENRRNHFRTVREEQKQNYKKKKEVLSELKKLGDHEDPEEAVRLAKEWQEQFKKIGFVPIKKKNSIEKEYKNACDRIYQRLRSEGKNRNTTDKEAGSVANDKSLRAEYFKLKKECEKLHEEILRYDDTKTFINPGGRGNILIDEIEQKIDKTKRRLEQKKEKLEELQKRMEGQAHT